MSKSPQPRLGDVGVRAPIGFRQLMEKLRSKRVAQRVLGPISQNHLPQRGSVWISREVLGVSLFGCTQNVEATMKADV